MRNSQFYRSLSQAKQSDGLQYTAINKLRAGNTLTKLHYTSGGSKKQYFLAKNDGNLVWGNTVGQILNKKPHHTFPFSQIRGVVYGHVTKTFQKFSNKNKFKRWLCLSIIMKERPFDIYCEPEHITNWFVGLSNLVKIYNPKAHCIKAGRYLWRRLRYVWLNIALSSLNEKNRKKILAAREMSFVKTIL
jgi:hypothetical protein